MNHPLRPHDAFVALATTPTVAKTAQLAQSDDPGRLSALDSRMYHRRTSPATEIEQNLMVTCMIITKYI
jgi:hypothetical protein